MELSEEMARKGWCIGNNNGFDYAYFVEPAEQDPESEREAIQ
jgi:hypothetical protein